MSRTAILKKWKVSFILMKTYKHFVKNIYDIEKSFRVSFLMLLFLLGPIALFCGYTNLENYAQSFDFSSTDLYNLSIPGVKGVWVYIVLYFSVHASLQAMVVLKFISKEAKSITFLKSLKFVLPRLPKILIISFIQLGVAVILLLLYYGGKQMLDVDYIASFFGVVLFGIFFWFFIATSFAIFAVLAEDKSVYCSLKYSMSLVKGSWWSTFIYSALATVLIFTLSDFIELISAKYFSNIPLRTNWTEINFQLELKRIAAFSIDLLSNVIFLFYYISLYFWYKYRKASYKYGSFFNLELVS